MASCSLKDCSVCEENFNEDDRCPRTLPCSHYFCTDCINNMIRNGSKQCPMCRCNFEANKAEDLMLNRAVIDFIRYVAQSASCPLAEKIANMEKEAAETRRCVNKACEEIKNEVERSVENVDKLLTGLQGRSTKLCSEILPMIVEVKNNNERRRDNIKGLRKSMTDRLSVLSEKQKQLQDMKAKIEEVNTLKEAAALFEEAKIASAANGEWTESCKTQIREDESKLHILEQEVQDTCEKIDKTAEVMSIIWGKTTDKTIEIMQAHKQDDQVTAEALMNMSIPVRRLVEQGKVYAIRVQQKATRSAIISIQDNRLCLHHLKKDSPPIDAYTVNHQDVLRLVNKNSRLAFLDLGFKGLALGRLHIRLSPDTNGARQFAMFCTGQAGPCYANTKLLSVHNKGLEGEQVLFGDYEHQNGKGGKGIVPIGTWNNAYQRPLLNGTLIGVGWWKKNDSISAQFFIRTRGCSQRWCDAAFGIVEEGLDVLTEAIHRYPNIKDVSITDCGLVLPC